MHKKLRTLLVIVCSAWTGSGLAQCGVSPAMSLNDLTYYYFGVSSQNTVLDPNWAAYGWEWEVNNQVVSTDSILDPAYMPMQLGLNQVCLKVSATNSLTGDSCTQQVCNIFQSHGASLLAQLDIVINGYTVDATGIAYGGNLFTGSFTYQIDWGDGSTTSFLNDSHTYASPGSYDICFTVMDMVNGFSDFTCRKAHIDNGLINMAISDFNTNVTPTCYPIVFACPTSTPPFTSGSLLWGTYNNSGVTGMTNGGTVNVPASPQEPLIPGMGWVTGDIFDINPGISAYSARHMPLFFDVCGAVPDTVSGYVFNDTDGDGIFDSTETGVANKQVAVTGYANSNNYSAYTDSTGFYRLLMANGIANIKLVSPGTGITFPPSGYHQVNGISNNSFPLLNFGLDSIDVTVNGKVFLDYNTDSVYNAGDVPVNRVTLKAVNQANGFEQFDITGSSGNYSFNLLSGDYKIYPVSMLLDSAISYPDTISISSNGGVFNNRNFAITSPVSGNFGLWVYGDGEARPGFDYSSKIGLINTGFDTMSASLVFNFDPLLTASSVTPAGGVIDNVNHTVTWQTGGVPAAAGRVFKVNYTISPAVPLGTVLNFDGQLTLDPGYTDSDLSNNASSYSITVTGSYDPNDKSVVPAGLGATGDVYPDERLHYRIRFQNTGTASAIHVVIQDEIDSDLDLNTLLMEDASHNYDMTTNGNTITWRFSNIQLPDSNTNEPASHGFIEYSLKPLPGLPDGTTITNTANIYFDFNAPVVTNTVLNTLFTNVGMDEPVAAGSIQVYPNPTRDWVTIRLKESNARTLDMEILDVTGKVCGKINARDADNSFFRANLSQLPPGVYFIRILSNQDIRRVKVIKN